jgi:hypothetical protein
MPPVPFRVKATSVEDSSQTHEFDSIQAARRALMEWQQKNVGGHLLKKFALERREAYGFRWEMLSPITNSVKDVQSKTNGNIVLTGRHMEGKTIYDFYNKPVVYLLECSLDGNAYVHIGSTENIQSRLPHVTKQYTSCSLYSVYTVFDPICLERKFKEMCIMYYHKNDLYTGMKAEEFDDILAELYCIMRGKSGYDKELEIMRINLEIERIKRDTEIHRMNHELEMKRLDLEIAKANKNIV